MRICEVSLLLKIVDQEDCLAPLGTCEEVIVVSSFSFGFLQPRDEERENSGSPLPRGAAKKEQAVQAATVLQGKMGGRQQDRNEHQVLLSSQARGAQRGKTGSFGVTLLGATTV